jgi:hypothetical protein
MRVCNKCNIEKPIDQYFKETRKDNGKTYIKRYCNDCFKKQSRDWKRNNRAKVKQDSLNRTILKNGGKYCSVCNELKLPDEYYANRTLCKECVRHMEREKDRVEREERDRQRELNGISNKRVPNKPGDYADELQRKSTHEFLTLLGWSYNLDNNLYYKEPLKSATGFWRGIEPSSLHSRTQMNRKRARIRNWVTEKTLPKLVLEKHRRSKTPPDEIINKCMYEYFINKTPGYKVAINNNITEGYVTHYIVKIYEMLYDKVE